MSEPMPFQPEPLEHLQARFWEALSREWVIPAGVGPDRPMVDRPGMHRTHVFDLDVDGERVRLIVSLDRAADDAQPWLHVSASFQSETYLPTVSSHIGRVGILLNMIGRDHIPNTLPIHAARVTDTPVFHLVFDWRPKCFEKGARS